MNAPQEIRLQAQRDILILVYDNQTFELSAEYLRVYSPSAQVRGHGTGNAILQTGKRHVKITDLDTVGNYALKISFSDGHDSGLYSWDYLCDLAQNHATHWQDYLHRLHHANASRDI